MVQGSERGNGKSEQRAILQSGSTNTRSGSLTVDKPSLACKSLQLWRTISVRAVHNSGSIVTNPVYKFVSAPYCAVDIQAYSCRVPFITRVTIPSILQYTPENSVLEKHFIMAPILPDLTNVIQ